MTENLVSRLPLRNGILLPNNVRLTKPLIIHTFVCHLSGRSTKNQTLKDEKINTLQKRLVKLSQIRPVRTAVSLMNDTPAPLQRIRREQMLPTGLLDVVSEDVPRSSQRKKETVEKPLFESLGLSEELLSAVRDLDLSDPTEIQSIGIPMVLQEKNAVLASHTGSGKTLAYLLPIVQLLREDEKNTGVTSKPKKPRAIVLCPTRELAEQVLAVAKSICHHARFRSAMISGGGPMKPQQDALMAPLDLLVATPGRLIQHHKEGNVSFQSVKYLVMDEADTLFDRGFGADVRRVLTPLRKRSTERGEPFQTVLVTATITNAVRHLLDEEFPGIEHVRTSSLHKKVANARHDFLQIKGDENKLETLQQILAPSMKKGHKIMVFCNTVQSCRAVDHVLNDAGIQTVNYHGEVPAEARVDNLNKFRGASSESSEDYGLYGSDDVAPVLVCTDLAARGLDLTVDHVIMFDFPNNPIDYLHRTGRTARMGAIGRITSLVAKHDYFLSKQIQDAIARGESLDNLTKDRAKVERVKKQELEEKRRLVRRTEGRGGSTFKQKGREDWARTGNSGSKRTGDLTRGNATTPLVTGRGSPIAPDGSSRGGRSTSYSSARGGASRPNTTRGGSASSWRGSRSGPSQGGRTNRSR